MTRRGDLEEAIADLEASESTDDEQVVIYRTVVDHDGTPQQTRRTVIDL